MTNQTGGGKPIHAINYQPSGSAQPSSSIFFIRAAAFIAALVLLTLFWFLFTASSVKLTFSPPTNDITITGGFSVKVGDSHLLRNGNYDVRASLAKHFEIDQRIEVLGSNSQSFDFTFTPVDGLLKLIIDPPDAKVTIANETRNAKDLITLSAQAHEISLSHPRYINKTIQVAIIGREQEQELFVSLDPDWSNVKLVTSPPSATIHIDGKDSNQKTPATIELPSGEREISVSKAGYKTHRVRILSVAGGNKILESILLTRADAKLRINSAPKNASVIINGDYLGQTPIDLDLRSNEPQNVKIVKKGYASQEQRVVLKQNQSKTVSLSLKKNLGKVVVQVMPENAKVFINEQDKGPGSKTLSLPTEEIKIRVALDGYAGFSKTITPKFGVTQQVKVRLLTDQEARLAALKPVISTQLSQNLLLFEPFDFKMGASRREPGRRANETIRNVKMARLFYLSTKEVSNKEFRQFAAGHDSGKYEEETLNDDDMPVVRVSWKEAVLFCNWLSNQEGFDPFYDIQLGKLIGINKLSTGFRLPTEAEWAWAARTDPNKNKPLKKFPWGQQLPPPDRTGNYADRAAANLVGRIIFGYNDNHSAAAPTGTFKSNSRGLYDLGGNAAEWIHDYYEIPDNQIKNDPLGPQIGDFHVIRGSSWMHGTSTDLRYSFRDYGIEARQDVGFRIAKYAE